MSTKNNAGTTLSMLNSLHARLEKASDALKREYEKIESDKAAQVAPLKKAYDIATAKLNLAIKALGKKVKFDTVNGKYIFAVDEKSGQENFVIEIRSVCSRTVPVAATTVEEAYKKVEKMINDNELDYEQEPSVTLDDVSQVV